MVYALMQNCDLRFVPISLTMSLDFECLSDGQCVVLVRATMSILDVRLEHGKFSRPLLERR